MNLAPFVAIRFILAEATSTVDMFRGRMYNGRMEQGWLTDGELVRAAADAGYANVTPRQLERWHKEDLIPRPRRVHLGFGPGTRSEYARETLPQLLTLCRLHSTVKRLDYVRLALWLEGYSMPVQRLKASLAARILDPLNRLAKPETDELEAAEALAVAAEALAVAAARKRRPPRSLRSVKRRLRNAQELETLLTSLFCMMLGGEQAFVPVSYSQVSNEPTATEILVRGLGLERAQTDTVAGVGPWLPEDVSEDLNHISDNRWLAMGSLSQIVEGASTEDLTQARADYSVFFVMLPRIAFAVEQAFGAGAFGLSAFGEADHDVCSRALLVLGMLRARQIGLGPRIDEIANTLRQVFSPAEQ